MSTVAGRIDTHIDYQQADRWYRGDNAGSFPENWIETDGIRHPQRPYLPAGELYRRRIPSLNVDFSLRRLDLQQDLERLTRWMNDPRVAEFWEQDWPEDKQAEYIEKTLADPHKQPVIGCFNDEAFAYFEIYWAMEDRLGPYYEAQAYDRGMHLLVGEMAYLGKEYFRPWIQSVCHFMFLDDSRTQRLVGEPRADNVALFKYLTHGYGWEKVREFDFPHKRAALMMCQRSDFFAQADFT